MDESRQKRLVAGLPVAIALVLAASGALYFALAQIPDRTSCEELREAACSRAIASGDFKGDRLAALYRDRGRFYYYSAKFDLAIADFREAIRLNPKDASVYIERGNIYRDNGNVEGAVADFSDAIRIAPTEALAYAHRCWARAVIGRELALALADCDEALRLKPGVAIWLAERGLVRLRLDRVDDAIADFNAALAIDGRAYVALYGRGLAKLKAGDGAGGNADIAAAKAADANITTEMARYGTQP